MEISSNINVQSQPVASKQSNDEIAVHYKFHHIKETSKPNSYTHNNLKQTSGSPAVDPDNADNAKASIEIKNRRVRSAEDLPGVNHDPLVDKLIRNGFTCILSPRDMTGFVDHPDQWVIEVMDTYDHHERCLVISGPSYENIANKDNIILKSITREQLNRLTTSGILNYVANSPFVDNEQTFQSLDCFYPTVQHLRSQGIGYIAMVDNPDNEPLKLFPYPSPGTTNPLTLVIAPESASENPEELTFVKTINLGIEGNENFITLCPPEILKLFTQVPEAPATCADDIVTQLQRNAIARVFIAENPNKETLRVLPQGPRAEFTDRHSLVIAPVSTSDYPEQLSFVNDINVALPNNPDFTLFCSPVIAEALAQADYIQIPEWQSTTRTIETLASSPATTDATTTKVTTTKATTTEATTPKATTSPVTPPQPHTTEDSPIRPFREMNWAKVLDKSIEQTPMPELHDELEQYANLYHSLALEEDQAQESVETDASPATFDPQQLSDIATKLNISVDISIQMEKFALIAKLFNNYATLINDREPEFANQLREIIDHLYDRFTVVLNQEDLEDAGHTRKKRADPEPANLADILKFEIEQALKLSERNQNIEQLKDFFQGYQLKRLEIMKKLSELDNSAETKALFTNKAEQLKEILNKLKQNAQGDNADFLEAGKQCFELNFSYSVTQTALGAEDSVKDFIIGFNTKDNKIVKLASLVENQNLNKVKYLTESSETQILRKFLNFSAIKTNPFFASELASQSSKLAEGYMLSSMYASANNKYESFLEHFKSTTYDSTYVNDLLMNHFTAMNVLLEYIEHVGNEERYREDQIPHPEDTQQLYPLSKLELLGYKESSRIFEQTVTGLAAAKRQLQRVRLEGVREEGQTDPNRYVVNEVRPDSVIAAITELIKAYKASLLNAYPIRTKDTVVEGKLSEQLLIKPRGEEKFGRLELKCESVPPESIALEPIPYNEGRKNFIKETFMYESPDKAYFECPSKTKVMVNPTQLTNTRPTKTNLYKQATKGRVRERILDSFGIKSSGVDYLESKIDAYKLTETFVNAFGDLKLQRNTALTVKDILLEDPEKLPDINIQKCQKIIQQIKKIKDNPAHAQYLAGDINPTYVPSATEISTKDGIVDQMEEILLSLPSDDKMVGEHASDNIRYLYQHVVQVIKEAEQLREAIKEKQKEMELNQGEQSNPQPVQAPTVENLDNKVIEWVDNAWERITNPNTETPGTSSDPVASKTNPLSVAQTIALMSAGALGQTLGLLPEHLRYSRFLYPSADFYKQTGIDQTTAKGDLEGSVAGYLSVRNTKDDLSREAWAQLVREAVDKLKGDSEFEAMSVADRMKMTLAEFESVLKEVMQKHDEGEGTSAQADKSEAHSGPSRAQGAKIASGVAAGAAIGLPVAGAGIHIATNEGAQQTVKEVGQGLKEGAKSVAEGAKKLAGKAAEKLGGKAAEQAGSKGVLEPEKEQGEPAPKKAKGKAKSKGKAKAKAKAKKEKVQCRRSVEGCNQRENGKNNEKMDPEEMPEEMEGADDFGEFMNAAEVADMLEGEALSKAAPAVASGAAGLAYLYVVWKAINQKTRKARHRKHHDNPFNPFHHHSDKQHQKEESRQPVRANAGEATSDRPAFSPPSMTTTETLSLSSRRFDELATAATREATKATLSSLAGSTGTLASELSREVTTAQSPSATSSHPVMSTGSGDTKQPASSRIPTASFSNNPVPTTDTTAGTPWTDNHGATTVSTIMAATGQTGAISATSGSPGHSASDQGGTTGMPVWSTTAAVTSAPGDTSDQASHGNATGISTVGYREETPSPAEYSSPAEVTADKQTGATSATSGIPDTSVSDQGGTTGMPGGSTTTTVTGAPRGTSDGASHGNTTGTVSHQPTTSETVGNSDRWSMSPTDDASINNDRTTTRTTTNSNANADCNQQLRAQVQELQRTLAQQEETCNTRIRQAINDIQDKKEPVPDQWHDPSDNSAANRYRRHAQDVGNAPRKEKAELSIHQEPRPAASSARSQHQGILPELISIMSASFAMRSIVSQFSSWLYPGNTSPDPVCPAKNANPAVGIKARVLYSGTCNAQLTDCLPNETTVVIDGQTPAACQALDAADCQVVARWSEGWNNDSQHRSPADVAVLRTLAAGAREAWNEDVQMMTSGQLHPLRLPGTGYQSFASILQRFRSRHHGPVPYGTASTTALASSHKPGTPHATRGEAVINCSGDLQHCTIDVKSSERLAPDQIHQTMSSADRDARASAHQSWRHIGHQAYNAGELANLLVHRLADRVLTRSAADPARGSMDQRASSPSVLRLMDYSYAILSTLQQEVMAFLTELGQDKNKTLSSDWQEKDLVSLAIIEHYRRQHPGGLRALLAASSKPFLEAVVHSPELGIRGEQLDNIFSLDDQGQDRIRGRDSLLQKTRGAQQFFLDGQQPKSGHRKDFVSCLLGVLAKQCLQQSESLDDQAILACAGSMKAQQETTLVGRLTGSLGGKTRNRDNHHDTHRWQEQLATIRNDATKGQADNEVNNHPALQALTGHNLSESRRCFMEQPIAEQHRLLKQLTTIADDYGWRTISEPCHSALGALSRARPTGQDSLAAWKLVALLFQVQHNVRQELQGSINLMEKLRPLSPSGTSMMDRHQLTQTFLSCLPQQENLVYQQLVAMDDGDEAPPLPFDGHQFDPQRMDRLVEIYAGIRRSMISQFDSELGRQDIKDPGVRAELILEGAQTCLQLLCESDASLATIADASIKEATTIILQEMRKTWEEDIA